MVHDPAAAFATLQARRLLPAWRADLPDSTTPRVVIGLPSYSVDSTLLEHYGARVTPLENRYLYVMLRAADPVTRVVYLSSRPVPAYVRDAYLSLVSAAERRSILERTLLVSPDDVSPRPLAAKIAARPDLIEAIRAFVGDEISLIEAWNVTEAERDLALALGAPINGTAPELRRLGTKSESRLLFRRAAIPHPRGTENLRSVEDVVRAIDDLRADGVGGVVVKLDDSVAGDGNIVLGADALGAGRATATIVDELLPAWYVDALAAGAVVEELVVGNSFQSPSGQGVVQPDGVVVVLAAHDQRLGGETGQVFQGCTFPADDAYARDIAHHTRAVGKALRDRGVVGRFGVDFVAAREGDAWRLFAVEINLRKGGTTHPLGITRLLTDGAYDPLTNRLVAPDATVRCYAATDNLVDPQWVGRDPDDVMRTLADASLLFDPATNTGVVPHLLDCLAVDGRMGYTAIGRDRDEVVALEARLRSALAGSAPHGEHEHPRSP